MSERATCYLIYADPSREGEWPRHAWPGVRIHCCLAAKSLVHENKMGGGTFERRKSSTEWQEVNVALKPFFFKVRNLHKAKLKNKQNKNK